MFSYLSMELKIIPFGRIPDAILNAVSEELKSMYKISLSVLQEMKLPKETYNQLRRQYNSTKILEFLAKNFDERILGIVKEDMYSHGLNFVFGEAQLKGKFSVVSIARLDPMFYGKPFDERLFVERSVKEAIHEVGHTFGLEHCPNKKCVMSFSNTIFDVDRKGKNLCEMCKLQLGL